jgi:hypothetical protein
MAKSKTTAEDIARLIRLECGPLPPSELTKISAWLNTETRKTRRQGWMVFSLCIFFASCAFFALCALVPPSRMPSISASMHSFAFGVGFVVLWLQLREISHRRRGFLQGFVWGVRAKNFESSPGAPKKWTMDVCKETVAAVKAIKAERGMSIARSIEILKQRDPEQWRSLSETRYYEAMKQLKKST